MTRKLSSSNLHRQPLLVFSRENKRDVFRYHVGLSQVFDERKKNIRSYLIGVTWCAHEDADP